MPRAVIAEEFGPPEAYALKEYDPGQPGPGFVRIEIKAIGVSYVDVLTAAGKYQVTPPLPFIPGSECAGIVEALGEGVTKFQIGDAVMGSAFGGIFAEAAVLRASSCSKVPEGMDLKEAAVFPPSYQTSFHALVDRGQLSNGETLLVLGAAGATGIAAIQIGKWLGARVIASASSPDKRELCLKAGADVAVDTRSASWRDEVKAAAQGKAIDVVYDPVGGAMTDPAFRTLGYNGRYLVIGFTGGISTLKTNLPLVKTASMIGVQVRTFGENEPEKSAANIAKIVELAGQGVLKPMIGKTFALEDYAAAMNAAFNGEGTGRVVMVTG